MAAFSAGLGHGSEFVVRLPLAAGAAPPDVPAAPTPARPSRKLRLLLVDDHLDNLESLALLLRLWGYQVDTARDGPSAVTAARAGLPDILLLDISLGDMDGREVCRLLRHEPGLERSYFVALTGFAGDDDERQSLAAGFDRHCVKPLDLGALERLLAEHGATLAEDA